MDSLELANLEIAHRSYCNFHERVGGYMPRKSIPIALASRQLSPSDRVALEAIKREFEDLGGVDLVSILENSSGFTKDDEISCRHIILVKLRSVPLRDRVQDMNSSFYYKTKKLGLESVELRIEWEDFIFDPPL